MIILDYQDRRPIYEQIVEKFQILIVQGVLEPDTQMPSVRKLAMELSINPNTIQRAYSELEKQGFIYPVKGKGNYVSPNPEIVEKKRQVYLEGLRKVIAQGRNLGIPKDVLLEQARRFYEEGAAMIQTNDISKKFSEIQAVSQVTLDIREGEVFGLVGTNGAGKSTLMRMLCGILKPDSGSILVDEQEVYENEAVKRNIFYISDDAYYFSNSTPMEMERYYRRFYPGYDSTWFYDMLNKFNLKKNRKINTFSKGMKKQLSLLLGISARTKYLLCDETFDGLDPVMRQTVKSLFASEMLNREFTPIIASHNLRELEDICDHVGLLHQGGVLLSRDLEDMKFHIHKVQCVLTDKAEEDRILKELHVIRCDRQGSLMMITARGTRTEILERINRQNPLFCEIIPLTLEEIFISETEVAGYEIKNLIC